MNKSTAAVAKAGYCACGSDRARGQNVVSKRIRGKLSANGVAGASIVVAGASIKVTGASIVVAGASIKVTGSSIGVLHTPERDPLSRRRGCAHAHAQGVSSLSVT